MGEVRPFNLKMIEVSSEGGNVLVEQLLELIDA